MTFAPSQRAATPTRGVVEGTVYSAPVGVVVVWAMNTFLLNEPMPAEIGAAMGAVANSAAIWVAQWLPKKRNLQR